MASNPKHKIFNGTISEKPKPNNLVYLYVKLFKPMLPVLIVSVALMLIAFALFSVRLLFFKKGEFRGSCASNSPFLQKEGAVCGVCGRKSGEACGKDDEMPTVKSPA